MSDKTNMQRSNKILKEHSGREHTCDQDRESKQK